MISTAKLLRIRRAVDFMCPRPIYPNSFLQIAVILKLIGLYHANILGKWPQELQAVSMGADRGFTTGRFTACPLWPDLK